MCRTRSVRAATTCFIFNTDSQSYKVDLIDVFIEYAYKVRPFRWHTIQPYPANIPAVTT